MIDDVLSRTVALAGRGRRSPHPDDVRLTAAVLVGISVPYLVPHGLPWGMWRYFLECASALPLIWRRRYPIPVAMACGGLSLVIAASIKPSQPLAYAPLISLYTIGSECTGRARTVMGILYFLGTVLGEVLHHNGKNGFQLVFSFATSITMFLLGVLMQTQRAYASSLEERARILERDRAAELERAAAAERARIARDMHDVVGHAVALMVVQAEAGPLLVRSKPEKAEAAFDAISEVGRDAMAQLRRLLGVLKQDDYPAARAPQPTVASIDALVEQVRRGGLEVSLTHSGSPIPLAADAEAAAYRVVQEALTNTIKHAAADKAEVCLDWSADSLGITVVDDGRGVMSGAEAVDGQGLVGLRERLAAVGGSLSVRSPLGSSGFALAAYIPAPD
jgi:signal transduction histidine kinase